MELASRAAFRGQVTKIIAAAIEYLKDDKSKLSAANSDNFEEMEEELMSFIQRLKTAHDNLNLVNEDIISKGIAKVDDPQDKVADYQDQAVDVLARLNTRLGRLQQKLNPDQVPDKAGNIAISARPSTSGFNGAKLQKLPLKTFDGNFSNWLSFWEQFKSAVHDDCNLNASEKFNYLESTLRGDARKAIDGFIPTEECYESAIALLQEQYGNNEKLIDKHILELVNLRPLRDRSDLPGLRSIYGSVVAGTRSLTALKVPPDQYAVMLKSVLLRCLPKSLRIDYYRQAERAEDTDMTSHTPKASDSISSRSSAPVSDDVKGILRFLKREIESMDRSDIGNIDSKCKPSAHYPTTASSLVAMSETRSCLFCQSQQHTVNECDSKMPIDEKRQILRKGSRCFRCAKIGHVAKVCRSSKSFVCTKCRGRHMSSMCNPSSSLIKTDVKTDNRSKIVNNSVSLCAHISKQKIFLKTARCLLYTPKAKTAIRLIIDGGSQFSYIRESLVKKMGLKITGTIGLTIIPFGSKQVQPVNEFQKVKLTLRSQFNRDAMTTVEAIIVPEICVDVLAAPNNKCAMFNRINLADVCPPHIEAENGLSVLIGADYYWSVVTGKQINFTNKLRGVETVFGWTLQGVQDAGEVVGNNEGISCFSSALMSLASQREDDMLEFWSLETLGIKSEEANNTVATQDLITKCISKEGARFVAKLPWKIDESYMDSNLGLAKQRLSSLIRRLSRNPTQFLEYDSAIRQLIRDGVAEPVEESSPAGARVFYLPHRPVYKTESRTTKVRIVFDASAHVEGKKSLNDQLWTGANLLPDVLQILLNFRFGRFGIVADIEKAFLQIVLHSEDRDSHRFMWFSSALRSANDKPPVGYFRMTRVTFGVTCSPFLLCAVIRRVLEHEKDTFVNSWATLQEGTYMDDLVISVDSESEGIEICKAAISILSKASMRLHKWNSNSMRVRTMVNYESAPLVQSVLGLSWFVHSDELSVSLSSVESLLISSGVKWTKRNVLQVIARIFDPLGMLGPTTVKLKIFFQNLWRQKLNWDEIFTNEQQTQWNECIMAVLQLKDVAIPRSVLLHPSNEGDIELHIFADASTKAFGTVAFARCILPTGDASTSFLCAKNRIAPLKIDGSNELTLPKLELTAALIAARLGAYLSKRLKATSAVYYFWTDSQITLNWIYGKKQRWQPYVQSRVDEIRKLTDISKWAHCRSEDNPADLLTRGISGELLKKNSLWAHGPHWLQDKKCDWRNNGKQKSSTITLLLAEDQRTNPREENPLMPYKDFSSWHRLLRVTGLVLRFIFRLRKKAVSKYEMTSSPAAEEIQAAENHWIRYVQKINFTQEITILQSGRSLGKSSIAKLSPFLDSDGLLRLGGRLQKLDAPLNIKHPILLPSKSHIVNLIIEDYHQQTLHAGARTVLTQIRKRFWILRGHQVVKRRITSCIVCKKLWGPHATEPFAPLPPERITLLRPFENVGVDFAGPLYCYDSRDKAKKVYVALFTCAAVRAVHLELVRSMTTEDFLQALRRFISRRGIPATILSDNAKTFRRAALELKSFPFDQETIQGFVSRRKIKWRFIAERAPWWGGFWERMVRTMKNVLKVTIGKAKLNFEELRTIVTEAEFVVNNRPLTYISADPLDLTPLTPADFLGIESSSPSLIKEIDANLMRQGWKQRFKYSTQLKRRWQNEYLHLLRSFHYNVLRSTPQLSIGDVVLLSDPGRARIGWKMAIIEETFTGRDQRVRSCLLRLANGTKLKRPIQLLYPLELQCSPGEDVDLNTET